ncbi:MAG: hypothetical protein ACI9IQ_001587, partial [Cyclobacteriaceae bacterium]
FEPVGREFESLWAHQTKKPSIGGLFSLVSSEERTPQFERSAAPQTAKGCPAGVSNLAKPNYESISRAASPKPKTTVYLL